MATWFGQSRAGGSLGSLGRVGGSPDPFLCMNIHEKSKLARHEKIIYDLGSPNGFRL